MNNSRLESFAPLSGVASVLVLVVASGILGIYEYLPGADRLVEVFSGSPTRIMVVGYLGLFSAILLMWFAGSIHSGLSDHEGGSRRLSMIAFSGCVASGIVVGIGFTSIIAIGARAGAVGGISPEQAVTLYDSYGTILGQLAAFTFAVLIGASGIVSLRKAIFPTWFGWVSILIALGLISPLGYFVLLLALVWLLGVSIELFRRGSS